LSPDGKNPLPEGITAEPNADNILQWTATLQGPPDSPYEAGVFKVELKYPEDYPFKAPAVVFATQIYHPNITPSGKICLDVLADNWSPSYNITTVLQQLQGLLAAPNPEDPLVKEPAVMMKQDMDLFLQRAKEYTLKYATPSGLQGLESASIVVAPKESAVAVDTLADAPATAPSFVERCLSAAIANVQAST